MATTWTKVVTESAAGTIAQDTGGNAATVTNGVYTNLLTSSGLGWVIDEDDLATDSATKVPTQQSVKKYVDDEVAKGDTTLDNTKIWIGTSSNAKAEFALSGDVTMTAGGAVTVVDDAITLGKMASGTDGELITWDASGDPVAVAVGTATHVLTSEGTGKVPIFKVIPTATDSATGLMSSTDHTAFSAIEASATSDQTASEIAALAITGYTVASSASAIAATDSIHEAFGILEFRVAKNDLKATDTTYTHPNHSGDVTSVADGAQTIADDAVTYAKMQNVGADERLLGNVSGAGSAVAELDQSAVLSFLGIDASSADDQTAAEMGTLFAADTTAVSFGGEVTVLGNFTVKGTTTTLSTTNLEVEDKTVVLGTPDTAYNNDTEASTGANGGGILLYTDAEGTTSNFAQMTWGASGGLTGWTASNTQEGKFPLAVMEFSTDSTAPDTNNDAAGVGSFHYDSGDDSLYIRTI